MEKTDRTLTGKKVLLDLDDLGCVSGGELTEDEKAAYRKQARQLKMVKSKKEFMEMNQKKPSEKNDYILSVWDEVHAPIENWGTGKR